MATHLSMLSFPLKPSFRLRQRGVVSGAWPFLLVMALTLLVGACGSDKAGDEASEIAATQRPEANPLRNAYFGDLHVHTRYSFDAYIFNVREDADAAYRYAKGEAIPHPSGQVLKLESGPFDFQAVTDHGFYLGVLPAMDDPDDPLYRQQLAVELRELGPGAGFARALQAMQTGELAALPEDEVRNAGRGAWQRIIEAAEKHNDPGKFTTFIGYEYTSSSEDQGNLHRNVIFRGSEAPEMPFTRLDSTDPQDLWNWLDQQRAEGREGLAIPHNSNGSNGQMFRLETFSGGALDAAYADQRMRNEPLVEITQVKGTSEVHPMMSPNDEWADFEIFPYRIATTLSSEPKGSYVREAYLNGLLLQDSRGFNPFRFGLIGSTDTHNAAGTPEEQNFHGKVGERDGTPQARGSAPLEEPGPDGKPKYSDGYFELWGASGLAGVWAEENTRESIYDAFRRKETFATTGPRMRIRFFGGYDFDDEMLGSADMVREAYETGVSMGADLLASGRAPSFLVMASRDPDSAPLQRIQIVKGWVQEGVAHEQIHDVACSDSLDPELDSDGNLRCPDNGATVSLEDCAYSVDRGAGQLEALWTDPRFDPSERAVYYARVLENPSCRWSTWDAIRAGVEPRTGVPSTLQERAWSSPIWYVPAQ